MKLQFEYISSAILASISTALPGLTTLTLSVVSCKECYGMFPPPQLFPALRHLTVQRCATGTQQVLWRSLVPYLIQLTSLTIHLQEEHYEQHYTLAPELTVPLWSRHLLSTPSASASTVEWLVLYEPLSQGLCKLLLKSMPVSLCMCRVLLECGDVALYTAPSSACQVQKDEVSSTHDP